MQPFATLCILSCVFLKTEDWKCSLIGKTKRVAAYLFKSFTGTEDGVNISDIVAYRIDGISLSLFFLLQLDFKRDEMNDEIYFIILRTFQSAEP